MDLKEGIPLHKQISDWLKKEIESGALTSDEKLPSENELSKKFDVSRVTVRRALQTLENEQLIYRCQGLGSFVTDQRTHQSFSILNDFTEELAGTGMKASSKLISFHQADISDRKDLLSYLDIGNKTIAIQLERVRLGDGEPIAYDVTWMPIFYGQLIEGYDLEKTTIFSILEDEFEIPIKKGCYRIEASMAGDRLAKHLKVDSQTPLLLMNRISYTIGDKPVYYQKRYYRNDRMVFELMAERQTSNSNKKDELPFKEIIPVFRDNN
ncbi:GntR family transcriptional regulator [Aliifodinibius salicampi]|uniref:GntR family transcriptional regulator n=1 Tax=Fodinibius salicampi TaxID=1920655 RepID=A0ABT3Q2I2_9BACT|nr:GntR family transcriptional regulator [Fodinibius salicampi]MCW9714213.1 GntR family transcriptional regulator [Fodinibius salicampi]